MNVIGPQDDLVRDPLSPAETGAPKWQGLIEVCGILLVFAALAWSPPPDVNEAHYLCKAKHFWQTDWCQGDLFLESANAHWVYLASIGAATQWFTLEQTAWIGRFMGWLVLAVGWRQLASKTTQNSGWIVLSAGLFIILNRLGHLAGEWVAGGAEAKTIAYGLVFLALAEWLGTKQWRAMIWLGLAVLFHPLVGLWATVAMLPLILADWFTSTDTRTAASYRSWALGICLFLVLAAVAIVPILGMNSQASSEVIQATYQNQVTQRLSHHQYLFDFGPERWVGFAGLVAGLVVMSAERFQAMAARVLTRVAWAAVCLSFFGAVLSVLAAWGYESCFALLRLYWFRLADVMIPTVLALLLPRLVERRLNWNPRRVVVGAFVLTSAFGAMRVVDRWTDPRPGSDRQALPFYPGDSRRTTETFQNWKRVCEWIRDNTPEEALFLTPLQQQTFKWYAQRAEVACWKDAPQNADDFVEWQRRMDELQWSFWPDLGYFALDDDQLAELAERYGIDYLVTPQRHVDQLGSAGLTTRFEQVYPIPTSDRTTYAVFRLRDSPAR